MRSGPLAARVFSLPALWVAPFLVAVATKKNDPWRSRRPSELESSSLSLPNPNFNHDLSIRSVAFIVVFVSLTQICLFCVMQVPPPEGLMVDV